MTMTMTKGLFLIFLFMLCIILGVSVVMIIYGLNIVYKGELEAGDRNGRRLKGMPARIIGFMYLLAPVVAVAVANSELLFLSLHLFGVPIESDVVVVFYVLFIVTGAMIGFLFVINILGRYLHGKQYIDSNNSSASLQSSNTYNAGLQTITKCHSNEGKRVELHEAMRGSQTKFFSSGWSLFIFSIPLSLYYIGGFSEFIKPHILLHFESENTQGNIFMFSIICYLFSTIFLPFFVAYYFLKRIRKNE